MTPRGRPRSFDREEALMQAMRVFWAKGYESTTLTDLQQAMGGLTAPSLYAAFGSKEALFREVVLLYHQTHGIPMAKALTEGATARASIEGLLRVAATTFCQPDTPRGCLLVLGAMNCMPENQGVQDYLRELRLLRQKVIRQRLKRGIAEGDVPRGADLTAMAAFYATVVHGLAIQARHAGCGGFRARSGRASGAAARAESRLRHSRLRRRSDRRWRGWSRAGVRRALPAGPGRRRAATCPARSASGAPRCACWWTAPSRPGRARSLQPVVGAPSARTVVSADRHAPDGLGSSRSIAKCACPPPGTSP